MRGNEIDSSVGDSTLFRKEYNWKPEYSLEDALEWMLNEN